MRVKVLYFGVLKDQVGASEQELDLEALSTVADLLRILWHGTSNGSMDRQRWQSVAVAVNREYSSADVLLRDGDEVALLPPVSGGGQQRENTGALQRGLGLRNITLRQDARDAD